ncbi:MAG: hypothetical protein CL916_07435 [Deltaproteobacteria bacterium]|nr:hypothetical protein [Deltaproteobacteria bacterium]
MIFLIISCTGNESDSANAVIETKMSGYVTQLLGMEGIEDVSVCDVDCTTTNGEGFYTLRSKHDFLGRQLVMTKDDMVPGLVPILAQHPSQTIPNISLVTPALIEAQMGMVDLEWEEGTGILVFSVSNGVFGDGINVPDITLSMRDDIGDGPFYTNSSGLPSTELTSTSVHGGGVWLNIPSGAHTLMPSNLPEGCAIVLGWGMIEAIEVPIQAGYITFMRLECISS